MADSEASANATKAPESDAAEDVPKDTPPSLVAGDTPAQAGASLGGSASGLGSSGEITPLGGIDTYISKPADYPHAPSKLLLLLTAATGLHSVNNQIQADNYAKEGFLVVMPDMFAGDPLPGSATYTEEKDPSIIEQVKMRAAETAKSFLIDLWLARNTPQKALPIVHKVLEAAKDEYADAVANGGGVYSVGYCFAGEKPDTVAWGQQQPTDEEAGVVKKGPFIKAGAIAHPTSIIREDFEGTKAPLAFICVENDQLFSEEIREYGEKYLKEKNVESEFRTYSGVPHGFAVTGDYPDDASIQARQTEAFDQMLAWLKSH
ncbi:Hydrolase [Lachnellula willkommii]|uniref:Hydrolase n=1 Tax=Lachnellula willkommii TaxID=215461 RepID=A0A559MD35_9HELO|nr:Hydrolase [Lachnellula willkommii]